jgi:hypothetical protein
MARPSKEITLITVWRVRVGAEPLIALPDSTPLPLFQTSVATCRLDRL